MTTAGLGEALAGVGITHGYGMAMDGDGVGTTLGDGTAGAGVATDGDGIPTGAMPELVSDGVVTTDSVGTVHFITEDTMEEDIITGGIPSTEVEEDMQVLFEALH